MIQKFIFEDGNDDIQGKSNIGMEFDSEQSTYDFYNFYGEELDLLLEEILVTK